MRDFRLRTDLQRAVLGGFSLPLGIEPFGLPQPVQGYSVTYTPGEEDEPDTYVFRVVVSHERLAALVDRAFDLLPPQVFCIVEVGSRDAYRAVDVYLGDEPVSLAEFREIWKRYEPVLLEDASIAAGANNEEPFVEVFLDMWKTLAIHVPLPMREDVERIMREFDLEEVTETWPLDALTEEGSALRVRQVLDLSDERYLDLDELLLELRYLLHLELNIDPDSNVDDAGRELGLTLWRATIIIEPMSGNADESTFAVVWATAGSLAEMEYLIEQALDAHPHWLLTDIFTIDRIAYDERPDELADLSPKREKARVHLIQFETPPSPEDEADPE